MLSVYGIILKSIIARVSAGAADNERPDRKTINGRTGIRLKSEDFPYVV
jgi:hypothetical protein